ncbi:MAG: glyoxalase [Gemmatimonadetes bacterium]|nr:glyoxalase [Gemmatimonadota bacterium]
MLGPVSLRIRDCDRVMAFWQGMLGLQSVILADGRIALATAGAEHPVLLLEIDPDAAEPGPGASGLYHVALLLPDRASLGHAFLALDRAGGRPAFVGAADHEVSEALYYRDPEGNGLELYRDRPRDEWRHVRRGGGEELLMGSDPLDLEGILAESGEPAPRAPALPAGTVVGHVHLQVVDLERTSAFYQEQLGMDVTVRSYPGARFLSWDGYHHHLGLNIWGGHARTAAPPGARGLIGWSVRFPGSAGEPEERVLGDPDGVRVSVVGRPA